MSLENTSIARDNTIRTSQLKLANIARLIVNQKLIRQLNNSNFQIKEFLKMY